MKTSLPLQLGLSLCLLAAGAGTTHAQVIFSDSMNYADNAAIQAAWLPGTTTVGSNPSVASTVTFSPTPLAGFNPSVPHGTFMSLGNGVRYRELGTTVTDQFTLTMQMSMTSYSRSPTILMLNSDGTQGYGVTMNSGNVDAFGGNGFVQVFRFNNNTYDSHSNFLTGIVALNSAVNSTHPALGYAVLAAPDSAQNNATYDTDNYQGFADLVWTWDNATDALTVSINGNPIINVVDSTFSSFSRVYVRGSTNGLFDEIVVAIPETGTGALALLAGLGLMVGVRRRRSRRVC